MNRSEVSARWAEKAARAGEESRESALGSGQCKHIYKFQRPRREKHTSSTVMEMRSVWLEQKVQVGAEAIELEVGPLCWWKRVLGGERCDQMCILENTPSAMWTVIKGEQERPIETLEVWCRTENGAQFPMFLQAEALLGTKSTIQECFQLSWSNIVTYFLREKFCLP